MTIQVELSPEGGARLAAEARARGQAIEEYAGNLLEEALAPPPRKSELTVERFRAMLDSLATGSERLPDMDAERLTREDFYEDRV